eukprot:14946275-Alexandrium_andersonii.AAC.1
MLPQGVRGKGGDGNKDSVHTIVAEQGGPVTRQPGQRTGNLGAAQLTDTQGAPRTCQWSATTLLIRPVFGTRSKVCHILTRNCNFVGTWLEEGSNTTLPNCNAKTDT